MLNFACFYVDNIIKKAYLFTTLNNYKISILIIKRLWENTNDKESEYYGCNEKIWKLII